MTKHLVLLESCSDIRTCERGNNSANNNNKKAVRDRNRNEERRRKKAAVKTLYRRLSAAGLEERQTKSQASVGYIYIYLFISTRCRQTTERGIYKKHREIDTVWTKHMKQTETIEDNTSTLHASKK